MKVLGPLIAVFTLLCTVQAGQESNERNQSKHRRAVQLDQILDTARQLLDQAQSHLQERSAILGYEP